MSKENLLQAAPTLARLFRTTGSGAQPQTQRNPIPFSKSWTRPGGSR